MKKTERDFSESLIYLSNLFGRKNMKAFDFNGFPIEFMEKVVRVGNSEQSSAELPSEGEEVVSVKLRVLGLNGRNWEVVEIHNDSVICEDSVDSRLLEDFIDVMERSTFRYF